MTYREIPIQLCDRDLRFMRFLNRDQDLRVHLHEFEYWRLVDAGLVDDRKFELTDKGRKALEALSDRLSG